MLGIIYQRRKRELDKLRKRRHEYIATIKELEDDLNRVEGLSTKNLIRSNIDIQSRLWLDDEKRIHKLREFLKSLGYKGN